MAFNPLAAGQGVAGALSNYGKSPSDKSSSSGKEPQHRDYQPVLKSKPSGKTGPYAAEAPGTSQPGDSFKKGGKVKRTGMAKVHRGERILTKAQAKKYQQGK